MKVWLAVAAVLLVVVAFVWQQPQVLVQQQSQITTEQDIDFSDPSNIDVSKLTPENILKLNTFKQATVDGALRTDHKGNLVIDMQLRHWIDFHLTAQGEMELEDIVAYMQQQMRLLPEPGRTRALTLLDQYLGYLNALGSYDAEEGKRVAQPGMNDLEARFNWQQRMRREWLDPDVVEAFFVAEEKIDEYTLAAHKLRRDGASEEEIATLDYMLPEEVVQMRKESRQLLTHVANEAQLREQGASAAEIHNWRVQEYGEAAAKRLADLDVKQADWKNRLIQYQDYQNSEALKNLSEADREKQLQNYRHKNFSDNEQKRLPAALQLLNTK